MINNNRQTDKKSESGQIMMLLVLLIVVLLGFSALAIDGGMVYSERRRAQNASDAAAMAAGLGDLQGSPKNLIYETARSQALANGFSTDPISTDPVNLNVFDGTDVHLEIYNPPISGKYASPRYDSYKYYQVILKTTTQPILAQFVFSGLLNNTVESIARVQNEEPPFPGDAIIATSPTACAGLWFAGTGGTTVTGGNVFSNSNRDGASGGASCFSGVQGGSSALTVNGGAIRVSGGWLDQGGAGSTFASNGIRQYQQVQDVPYFPPPDCSALPERVYNNSMSTLDPGRYPGGIKVSSATASIALNPGPYCLYDNFKMTGGSITGNGVFIIMKNGEFDLGGNTLVSLSAPTTPLVLGDTGGWADLLLYMDPGNTGTVKITGTSGSVYVGSIYAPSPASPESKYKCSIEGTGDSLGLTSQVICFSIKISGSAAVNVVFQDDKVFHTQPSITLVK